MNGIQHGDNILLNLQKTLELSLKYGDADDANIENYKDMAKSVCKIEHGFVLGHDIIKEAAKAATVEAFDEVLEEHRNDSHAKFKSSSSKRYMDFVKKAQRSVDIQSDGPSQSSQDVVSMDVDDMQPNELISDIDPITKQQLVNPVRNKHCNHIYGRDSVLQLVQQNPRLRCPIVGCANKKHIQMTDLIDDEELALRLARQRKNQH